MAARFGNYGYRIQALNLFFTQIIYHVYIAKAIEVGR